jgi:fumarate reductase flavoprotein subunit
MREPDRRRWPRRSRAAARRSRPAGDLNSIRENLYDLMWDDVGIVRDAASLARGAARLDELEAQLDTTGVESGSLAFNLTGTTGSISRAAAGQQIDLLRRDGAHRLARRPFPRRFPAVRDLENSRYTCVSWRDGRFDIATQAGAVHAREARRDSADAGGGRSLKVACFARVEVRYSPAFYPEHGNE